ncbi:MAG: valyl-tRNA synthetase [Candidatus Berkelbacteria bacterium Licking1014_96]|uniref:valine--tRNA ligase n=1 Tax=Candidatus Berkelbacteria bacterium Licking1014_96 TaxID=2017149 RepID=A0A554LGX6_9BACT|nr:MAG: valyl-tRNA synthetase [Candidatus Berkelbacteria bacterium Licking1014_96]
MVKNKFKKRYNPKAIEPKIYKFWEDSGYFTPKGSGRPFTIAMPPPNITGSLHLGHALNATIQDILIRYHRMKGYRTLWIPGLDHAGIATQNMVEKELLKSKKTRHDIGRAELLKLLHHWEKKYSARIINQFKKIGASADWSRCRYTLDEEYSRAVKKAFILYKRKGYIKRGLRIVNFCPRCKTAISDIEVDHKEEKGKLYYLKYRLLKREEDKRFEHLTIATTRPETLLGDTAVAVNPEDKRYKKFIGRKIFVPLVKRKVKVIADSAIDPKFGTGALKVTPAHDGKDFEIGERHHLKKIKVIDEEAEMTGKIPLKYRGLDRFKAREEIIKDIKKEKIFVKSESITHKIPYCYRCGEIIEPLISKQWFLSMKKLALPAIKVVREDKIKFIPSRYKKVYLRWMEHIRDWCISRQIWWGHKIPISGEEDVLDTWFSSALWPFASLGWPKKTNDLKTYYPTSVLSTAKDIIFLWVARMIFSGLFFRDKIPFKKVYIHPTILNAEGRRMSKSLGTGIDPLALIDKYGADATRFGLIAKAGHNQEIKYSESSIVAGRNFSNKMLNAVRFILMHISKNKIDGLKIDNDILSDKKLLKIEANKKTVELLKKTKNKIEKHLLDFRFNLAADSIYEFFWHQFCDKCLEANKDTLYQGSKSDKIKTLEFLITIISDSLKLVHPFMPFVTEHLWSELNKALKIKANPLIINPWPK